ncbi:hypothetical protein QNI16_33240 [Cytophagaceae bacterium YF14B1]|uniref:Uncharacterized protein n=1 Tax=Xanthocytophaga flava TaxID=3048013 RepID=A0AAE3UCE5_9BACT|nr:hypothetical protein [Xanthocytophaga flavus]MDJ1485403.1 hypothetical protein [Xanthocytophaga flavus]
MKHFALFFLFLLFSTITSVIAQDSFLISLRKQSIQIENRDFYVTKVIDARTEESELGVVYKGMLNNPRDAYFEKELTEELQGFFDTNLPRRKGDNALIVKVIYLTISETITAGGETATASIGLDFISNSNDTLRLVHQTYALSKQEGMDVTQKHDENIARALAKCMQKLVKSNYQKQISQGMVLSESEMNAPATDDSKFDKLPIFQAEVPQKGIYYSFNEFRSNTPSYTDNFDVERSIRKGQRWNGEERAIPYVRGKDGKPTMVRDAWGFSDGQQVYIHAQNDYFPLKKVGRRFLFDAYASTNAASPAIATGALVGGVVGGVVTVVVGGATNNNTIQTYWLNMETGQIQAVSSHPEIVGATPRSSARCIIYYRGDKAKDDKTILIRLSNQSDTLRRELKPNSIVEVEWTSLLSELSLCAESENGECFSLQPDVSIPNYFQYLPAGARKNSYSITPVKEQEAVFYLKQIRYAQENAAKKEGKGQ